MRNASLLWLTVGLLLGWAIPAARADGSAGKGTPSVEILAIDAGQYPKMALMLDLREGGAPSRDLDAEDLEIYEDGVLLPSGKLVVEVDGTVATIRFEGTQSLRGGAVRTLTVSVHSGGETAVASRDFFEGGAEVSTGRQAGTWIPVTPFSIALVTLLVLGPVIVVVAWSISRRRRAPLEACERCGEPREPGLEECPYCGPEPPEIPEPLLQQLARTTIITGVQERAWDPDRTPIFRKVWHLRLRRPRGRELIFPLDGERPTMLGSDPRAGIRLTRLGLLPMELRLQPEEDGVRLVAFGQRGRIRVNGMEVEECLLGLEDRAEVGDVSFSLELDLQPV